MRSSLPESSKTKSKEDKRPRSYALQSETAFTVANPLFSHTPLLPYFNSTESLNTQKIIPYYKTTPCSKACSREDCFFYHSIEDRRRAPFVGDFLAYSSQHCPASFSGRVCPNGDSCSYSHNTFESLFHPETYKTTPCTEDCKRTYCRFAHTENELRKSNKVVVYSIAMDNTTITHPIPPFGSASSDYSLFAPTKTTWNILDIKTFKSKPCPYPHPHSQKQCIYYHSSGDRRRVPVFYSYERCPHSKYARCPLEDACQKSHNVVEQLYHPEKYKKKMCHEYLDRLEDCEYGSFCSFAHSEAELAIELIHEYEKDENFYMYSFKTQSCPFNHEHNKSICAYAHNWQDYRRKVDMSYPQYSPKMCPNWDTIKFINKYSEGCPRGFSCTYSHGWKEQLYHPYSYKTTSCQDISKCYQGFDCPYYHGEFDHRYPGPLPKAERSDRRFSEGTNTIKRSLTAEEIGSERIFSNILKEAKFVSPSKVETQSSIVTSAKTSLSSTIPVSEFSELKISLNKQLEQTEDVEEEKKRATLGEKNKEEYINSSKSCPSSPCLPHRQYGKIPVLMDLRLSEDEENNEGMEETRLKKLMESIGLEKVTEKLLRAGYGYCNLLVDPEGKCRSAGIVSKEEIQRIVNKVNQILERPIGSESPSMIIVRNRIGRRS